MYKFIRYKIKNKSGLEKWSYNMFDESWFESEDSVEQISEYLVGTDAYFNEGYRGIIIEIVDNPPQEWINEQIKELKTRISDAQSTMEFLENVISRKENGDSDGSCGNSCNCGERSL